MGAHIDYKVNKNFILGASALNLTEKPLTQKINIGDEVKYIPFSSFGL